MKKRGILILCAALVSCFLWSCAAPQNEEKTGPVLWFSGDTTQWTDTTVAVDTVPYSGDMTVPALMEGLLSGPSAESGLLSPIPLGTRLLDWRLDRSGLLQVELSEEYGTLAGVDLTLADYCITLTLDQLAGVEQVIITVNGDLPDNRYRQSLTADQVILSGAEEQPVEVPAALYFPRSGGRGLGLEERTFQVTEGDVLVEIVTQALLEGPTSAGLTSLIPEETSLLSAHLEDGVCYVDFSAELVEQMPEGEDAQTLVLYSLADTLGNLESVESVVLRVEGETMTRYGMVEFGGVLEPDFGMAGNH